MLKPIALNVEWSQPVDCELCTETCEVRIMGENHGVLGPTLTARLPPGWTFFRDETNNNTAIMCPDCTKTATTTYPAHEKAAR